MLVFQPSSNTTKPNALSLTTNTTPTHTLPEITVVPASMRMNKVTREPESQNTKNADLSVSALFRTTRRTIILMLPCRMGEMRKHVHIYRPFALIYPASSLQPAARSL